MPKSRLKLRKPLPLSYIESPPGDGRTRQPGLFAPPRNAFSLKSAKRIPMNGIRSLVGVLLFVAWPIGNVAALEFRSVATEHAVLYDAPSVRAKKRYTASRYYPIEVIVSLEQFVKVRDYAGELFWIEKDDLDTYRTVLVTVARADIRQAPDKNARLVFQAVRDVVLELSEEARYGWVKVRHRDGLSGFVAISQVWGI